MNIEKKINGSELIVSIEGRLDTNSSSDLEKEVENLNEIDSLIFDFNNLEYISSSGLRILLACQKKMNLQGKMIIKNVNSNIMEIFEITGFSDILNIE